jgi:putative two-component system response regulator
MKAENKEILIVDDKLTNIELLNSFLKKEGYKVRNATNGKTALLSVSAKQPDLIILDINMPDMNGFEVCKRLKANPKTEHIPIMFISALNDLESKIEAFRIGGVDYVVKPYSSEEVIARVHTHLELSDYQHHLEEKVAEGLHSIKKLNEELESTQNEMIITVASILDAKENATGKHVMRVAEFSKLLAELYKLDKETTELIYKAAPLHDAGKVAIPDEILHKPGPLTEEERVIMNTHAIKGYEIFKNSTKPILQMAAVITKEHHERWNGSGYPYGLKGYEIHIAGRIVILADVFDALTHKRVYKEAWSYEEALSYILAERGFLFEPKLVDLFSSNYEEFIAIDKKFQD